MRRLLAVLNVLVALIVAAAVDVIFPTKFSNAEQYFLGLLIFTVLTLVELLFAIHEMSEKVETAVKLRKDEDRAWEARTELDRKLQEVQRLFHQLDVESSNSVDLFYEYHKKKLSDLERSLRDACVKQQTPIDETMFSVTSWLLGSSFHGKPEEILRAVLPTKGLDFFFDVHTRMYFSQMWQLVSAGSASGVHRLIILDDNAHLADDRLKRLITFHNVKPGYACKIISRSDFDRIVADYRLQHLVVDFGIYGNTYLYKGLTNQEENIVGVYSKDPIEVGEFINCFESCWNAAHEYAIKDAGMQAKDVSVEWVFADASEAK